MYDLMYYEMVVSNQQGPATLFIVEPSIGPVRAIRLHHPTRIWIFDPMTVQYSRTTRRWRVRD
jgi:hypothetical protein